MKLFLFFVVLLVITVLSFSSCTYISQGVFVPADRSAIAQEDDYFGDKAKEIVYLDQNWDRWDSLWFYNTTQGSNLLPYDLFVNLEQAGSTELFRSTENMSRYRYLPQRESFDNPDGLPVGFVKDHYQGKDYLGLTCAACHTTQINYQSVGMRIDGGPAMADMLSFMYDLEAALEATDNDDEKFSRLASKVEGDVLSVRHSLQRTLRTIKNYNQMNEPVNGEHVIDYGFARLDAFGRIYNRVLTHMTPGNLSNINPPNAPVSYPALWDTPQHDFVQWNGVANNNDGSPVGFLGPLGRNTGEVLGVFASFSLHEQDISLGYKSSVDKRNLGRLERHLMALESPVWPEEILPPIDQALAEKGEEVFKAYRCQLCHSDDEAFVRDNPKRRVIAEFSSVDLIETDKQMASNAIEYAGKSGMMAGRSKIFTDPLGEKFGEETPVVFALTNAAQGVIVARDPDKSWIQGRLEWLYDVIAAFFSNPIRTATERHVDFEINSAFPESLNAYKARPLNGIWATAPYLHNGSVPNLYELFLPACDDSEVESKECRSNKFNVGNREFDPKKVGFVALDKEQYPELFEFDSVLPGNRNTGHEYAVGKTPVIKVDAKGKAVRDGSGEFVMEYLPPITDEDRWALLEYLKTL